MSELFPFFSKKKDIEWDGKCHGCQKQVFQPTVAQIGPFWICDECIENHFANSKYSVNQAADILEKIRGYK